jgi:hypothetical protein
MGAEPTKDDADDTSNNLSLDLRSGIWARMEGFKHVLTDIDKLEVLVRCGAWMTKVALDETIRSVDYGRHKAGASDKSR